MHGDKKRELPLLVIPQKKQRQPRGMTILE
jgi:hypothetical protein